MAASPLLSISDLSVALPPGSDRALGVNRVTLSVDAGQTLCVVGESGSGKTLTASAIVGLLPSRRLRIVGGSILFEGKDLLRVDERGMRAIRGSRIGYVFQDPLSSLNPLERIGKQVIEVLKLHRWPGDRQQRVVDLLTDVNLPNPVTIANAYPWQLSGGQRQRVMIAMAIAVEPALLIADEPTSALDVTTAAQILALLRELQRRRGIGLFLITHDFGVVAEMADQVAVMRHGELLEAGTREQIFHRSRHAYTRQLLGAVPSLRARETQSTAGSPLLRAGHLYKTWRSGTGFLRPARRVAALSDVSLQLAEGETLAVVGESGSGKSTLARALCCLTPIDTGRADLAGIADDYLSLPDRRRIAIRRSVQMVFQDPYSSLNPRRTVGESITLGLRAQGEGAATAWARARTLLARVQLKPEAIDRYPNEFSGGQRQRIVIARALATRPRLLIADEPVSALDMSVQAEILTLLESIQREEGLALLFITHDLRVAARMADRVMVMRRGEVVESTSMREALQAPAHPYTAELVAAVPKGRELESPDGQPSS